MTINTYLDSEAGEHEADIERPFRYYIDETYRTYIDPSEHETSNFLISKVILKKKDYTIFHSNED